MFDGLFKKSELNQQAATVKPIIKPRPTFSAIAVRIARAIRVVLVNRMNGAPKKMVKAVLLGKVKNQNKQMTPSR